MKIQKVSKADAEQRLKDHRGWMRNWLAQHAEAVKLEKSCRIAKDFGKDFVTGMDGTGTKALLQQDKAQAAMDRNSVWITIYKRLLRGFEDGEYQDTQTVVGGICDGCKQPHRDLTKRDDSYYCRGCLGLGEEEVDDESRCLVCHQPIEDADRWRSQEGQDYCAECYALR